MEKLAEKLDSYDILNNLLPGIVLDFLFEKILGINLVNGNMVENLFVFYFIGMIVSRIGSLVLEPICKKIKWVTYADYGDFVKASRKDEKINVLSEINNSYRTIFSVCLIVIVGKVYFGIISKINFLSDVSNMVMLIAMTVLFAIAYKKQTKYVARRVNKVNKQGEES